MRRIKLLFFMAALCLGTTAAWADANGTCGATGNEANVTWSYVESTHTLTISGTGAMAYYAPTSRPWYDVLNDIEKVIVENGVTEISMYAFMDCYYLHSASIANSVTRVDDYAFSACSYLKDVYVGWENPYSSISSFGTNVFYGLVTSEINLHMPVDLYSNYQACSWFNNFCLSPYGTCGTGMTWFMHGDTMTVSGIGPMMDCSASPTISERPWYQYVNTRLKVIEITDGVTHIGNSYFAYCNEVTKLIISNTVTSIGTNAFYYCDKLKNVYVTWDDPALVSVGTDAFGDIDLAHTDLHVDQELVPVYASGPSPWSDFRLFTEYNEASITNSLGGKHYFFLMEDALDAWEENSTLKLLAPVEITDRIEVTHTCTLDLNGYGIKSTGDHEVIFLNTHGGTFTLEDSNTGNQTHRYKQNPSDVFAALDETEGEIVLSGGYITNGRGNKTETVSGARDGGAFFVLETTFIMNGGNIIGNYTKRHGAGVFIAKGSHFIMNGGRITHNYANLAGAVSVYATTSDINDNASSTMEMHGGEISYNFAKYNSGGIHSNSASASMYATITIDGGSIINNHVDGSIDQHCGGIGIGGYSQIHISGNPTISGNTFGDVVENIYIYSGSTLIIDGELTNSTPFPVTLETSGVFTSGLSGNGTAANFAMENTGTFLVTRVDGEAAILGPKACTANVDPQKPTDYYSTFYHSQYKYELPADVEAYTAERSGSDLILAKIAEAGDALPYGEAVILKTTGAALELIPTDADPVVVGSNDLLGKDAPEAAPANCYVLSGHSTDNSIQEVGFYQFTGTLAANKAYMIVPPGASPAPQHLRFVFGTTTDVEEVESGESRVESQKILRDGQLIILRNGVEYNANGQALR